MFVIVDLSDERNRRFERYRKHTIETKRCDVLGSAPFFVAKGHRIYYDYDMLEGIIKRCGAALFRNGIVPEGLEKYSFVPSVLPLKMLVRTAADFFSGQSSEKRSVRVCVYDRYGRAVSEMRDLSRYVRFVSVMTQRPEAYFNVAAELLESCGAAINIGDYSQRETDSELVIALSDSEFLPQKAKCCLVYSKTTACDNVFAVRDSTFLPAEHEEERAGTGAYIFFCALYETCGYKIHEIPVFSDAKSILFKTFT